MIGSCNCPITVSDDTIQLQLLRSISSLNTAVYAPIMFVEIEFFMISQLIISITKFLILIGSLHAYLSCNQCAIIWVSNCRYSVSFF